MVDDTEDTTIATTTELHDLIPQSVVKEDHEIEKRGLIALGEHRANFLDAHKGEITQEMYAARIGRTQQAVSKSITLYRKHAVTTQVVNDRKTRSDAGNPRIGGGKSKPITVDLDPGHQCKVALNAADIITAFVKNGGEVTPELLEQLGECADTFTDLYDLAKQSDYPNEDTPGWDDEEEEGEDPKTMTAG